MYRKTVQDCNETPVSPINIYCELRLIQSDDVVYIYSKGSYLVICMIFSKRFDETFKKFVGKSTFSVKYLYTLHLSTEQTIAFYSEKKEEI